MPRKTKSNHVGVATVFILIVGSIIGYISEAMTAFTQKMEMTFGPDATIYIAISLIIIIVGSALWVTNNKTTQRKKFLLSKYNDPVIVQNIIDKKVWIGQSSEQLKDSLGSAADIDQKVLKSKKKETWKYNQTSANRYGLKIMIEDDVVVGWDQKD